jgi:hypothetical protein
MLIGFGGDLVEVKAGKSGQNYWSRRLRPHEAGPLGPFETFDEALQAIKATKEQPEEA